MHLKTHQGTDRVNDYVLPYLTSLITENPNSKSTINETLVSLFNKGMLYDIRIWTFLLGVHEDEKVTQLIWKDILEGGVDERAIEVYIGKFKLSKEDAIRLREELLD